MASREQDEAEMLRRVGLGMDAEVFLQSDLGRALMEAAINESMDAMNELKTIKRSSFQSPRQYEARIEELQNVVARAEGFETWIAGLITEGRNNQEILLNLDQEQDHD